MNYITLKTTNLEINHNLEQTLGIGHCYRNSHVSMLLNKTVYTKGHDVLCDSKRHSTGKPARVAAQNISLAPPWLLPAEAHNYWCCVRRKQRHRTCPASIPTCPPSTPTPIPSALPSLFKALEAPVSQVSRHIPSEAPPGLARRSENPKHAP